MIKNKGVSLITLIITIVVIIILAAVVILALKNSDIVNNVNEAKFKNDMKSFDEQVRVAISELYIHNQDIIKEKITDSEKLYEIVPQLKDSKYDGRVYVDNGRLTLDPSKFEQYEIEWAIEIDIQIGSVAQIKDFTLSSTATTITSTVDMGTSSANEYMYKVNDGEWVTTSDNPYTISNLKPSTSYTIQVKAKIGGSLTAEKQKSITTGEMSGLVSIVPDKTEWTNGRVILTISYPDIPQGYEIQYKYKKASIWSKYTGPVSVTSNDDIDARIYNAVSNDSRGESSCSVTNIDVTEPNTPQLAVISGDYVFVEGMGNIYYTDIKYQIKNLVDTGSGVDRVEVFCNDVEIPVSNNTITVNTDGTNNLTIYVYDRAGNETRWSPDPIYRDTEPPVIEASDITVTWQYDEYTFMDGVSINDNWGVRESSYSPETLEIGENIITYVAYDFANHRTEVTRKIYYNP